MVVPTPDPHWFDALKQQDGLQQDLLFTFMMVFARAEYAFKAIGCIRDKEKWKDDAARLAFVHWPSVAGKVESVFFQTLSPEVEKAIHYLEKNRPLIHRWKKVPFAGDAYQLCWKDRSEQESESRLTKILEDIGSIRNNLFHGGKELGSIPCERDRDLLSASIWVLSRVLGVCSEASKPFWDVSAA
jgi:hypothetical protein